MLNQLYNQGRDVAVSTLRAELSAWIDQVRSGEEVVVTDRGIPVARLSPVGTGPLLDELVRRGVIGKPHDFPRPTARSIERARASGSVSEFVSEQRR